MHKEPDFLALSRWGQVPVLIHDDKIYTQSAAIVEHLAEILGRFQGSDPATRQAVREWLYWDVDALFPPIWNCYGVQLGQRKLLPINIEPSIANYHRERAETAISVLDSHLAHRNFLTATTPTIADLFCYGDIAFAEICEFDLKRWANVANWAARVTTLPGFKAPFALLKMESAPEIS
jgi:glutathione S-transferase